MIKKRETTRWVEERRDSNGKLLCLVPKCSNLRQKYKTNNRTRNYCKDHGGSDMQAYTNWQCLRGKALVRDSHACVKCGDNREYVTVTKKSKRIKNFPNFLKNKRVEYEHYTYEDTVGNFIVDHIIPIALGGDEWDMENLQTLCKKCNKIKTKTDMADIALQRRKDKWDEDIKRIRQENTALIQND